MTKKKKETIGVISGMEMLKKTRGINRPAFRCESHRTQKDRPRDRNWKNWV